MHCVDVESARAGHSIRRAVLTVALLLTWALAPRRETSAAEADPPKATSSREAREDAVRGIPFDRFDAEVERQVRAVVDNTSIFRRLPTQSVRCDPALYDFLIDHPDATVDLWQLLGMSKMSLVKSGDNTYEMDDGQGTTGQVRVIYRNPDTRVFYCTGGYEGKVFHRRVNGRCVLVLRTSYAREPNGEWLISSRLDTFIALEQVGAELMARTFKPLVGKVIDHNFIEAMAFAGSLSKTAEINPASTIALSDRMRNVAPADQQQLAELLSAIGSAAAGQDAVRTAAEEPLPLGETVER